MKTVDPAIAAHRAARVSTHAEILVWIEALNRSTGVTETMGLWTGPDHQQFIVEGVARDYYGAGNLLVVPVFQSQVGLEARSYDIGLTAVSEDVELLVRGYETRFAPIEVHRVEFDDDHNPLAAPERIFRGWVNGAPIPTPAIGGEAGMSLRVISHSHILTKYGNATKSDEYQQRRQGDRFRRYGSIRQAAVYWGRKRKGQEDEARPSLPDHLTGAFKR